MDQGIGANVARVRTRIAEAAARVGRDASDVTLVAVTKTRTPDEIAAAYDAGVRHIGENRVEEAEEKQPQLDLPGVTWHMVGHVQSRKARRAVERFGIVHSLDSVKLARALDRLASEHGSALRVLIEINVSGETSKYGFRLSDQAVLDAAVSEIVALPYLRVEGLMTVAPIVDDPQKARPVFTRLCALRDEFRSRFPEVEWTHLSMGMTDDFEVAIEEGATMVRVGRAIFGPRT